MAESKIQYSDLIEAEAIPKLISELKKVEKVMDQIAVSAGKVVAESAKMADAKPLTGYENLLEIQKEVDKVREATEKLRQAEAKRTTALAERERLEKRLAQIKVSEAKALSALKLQILQEAKALKDQATATSIAEKAFKAKLKTESDAVKEKKRLLKEEEKALKDSTRANSMAEKEAALLAKKLEQDAKAAKDLQCQLVQDG